jgi:hypothetical protein
MTTTAPRHRSAARPSRLRLGATLTAVLVLAGVAGYTIWSRAGADPHRYPDEGNALAVPAAPGSMTEALNVFGLRLPCDAVDPRYRDDKPVIGSGGTLHLRFATSKPCLGDFLRDLKLTVGALRRSKPGDVTFPFAEMDRTTYAADFGWQFSRVHTYAWQVTESTELVQSTIVIDDSAAQPVVYLVADRSEPE